MPKRINKPLVSVVMPVHNSEKFLDTSIQSILDQTFKNFEFIIINDASSDRSVEIIKKYMKKDSRIILINNKKNIRGAASRNRGIKISKGRYIATMDSDDVSLPDRLRKEVEFMENNKDVFLVGSGAIHIDEDGNEKDEFRPITSSLAINKALEERDCIYHPTILFRNKHVLYREKFANAEDYDFYLNLLSKRKKLLNLPDILLKYRISPNSESYARRTKQEMFAQKALQFYKERKRYGRDNYDAFDNNTILSLDIDKSKDTKILYKEIIVSWQVSNFKRVRKLFFRYLRYGGFSFKVFRYYILSLLGKKTLNNLRTIKAKLIKKNH